MPSSKGMTFSEPLSFEMSKKGLSGFDTEMPKILKSKLKNVRNSIGLPEMSEPSVVRHFTRLSTLNYGIDSTFYPLGSCTMKHNPRINEKTARLDGFANIHPSQPISSIQGALELMYNLQNWLSELSGLPGVTLMPAAGAHGELAGIMVIKKALEARGEKRNLIIVPDSAHGTNPATAAMCGFSIVSVPVKSNGLADFDELEKVVNQHGTNIAGIMLTNPSTCGLFEYEAKKIADLIHSVGGYFYCDGANFNAIVAKSKPSEFGVDVMHFNLHKTFSTPHGGGGPGCGPIAVSADLEKYLPIPKIIKLPNESFDVITEDANSIGKIKSFFGQFGVMVRAYSYMLSQGIDGLKQVAEDAVLSANYIYYALKDFYHAPYLSAEQPYCMHECLFTDKTQKDATGVTTLNIAKTLLENGLHPMTTFFPLVVHGAMLIEPTETESKDTIDHFISVMKQIASDSITNPDTIKANPISTPRKKLNDVLAAKKALTTYDLLLADEAK